MIANFTGIGKRDSALALAAVLPLFPVKSHIPGGEDALCDSPRPGPLGEPTAEWDHKLWAEAEVAEITNYPWEDSGHHPLVRARVMYDDYFIGVSFQVEDQYVFSQCQSFGDSVCRDSCVEFFFSPHRDPEEDAYFNIEVNCGGVALMCSCPSSADRAAGANPLRDPADEAFFRFAHSLPKTVQPEITEPTTWTLEYHVEWGLFEKYHPGITPESGTQWRGNFFKCGHDMSHPHWGSWALVETPAPNFHTPAFFQPLTFA